MSTSGCGSPLSVSKECRWGMGGRVLSLLVTLSRYLQQTRGISEKKQEHWHCDIEKKTRELANLFTCPEQSWLLRRLCSPAAGGCWRAAQRAPTEKWPWCHRRKNSLQPPLRSQTASQIGREWGTRRGKWWRSHRGPACSRTAEERTHGRAPQTPPDQQGLLEKKRSFA